MKAKDIKVGGYYRAKVSDRLTTVRVSAMGPGHNGRTVYCVENLRTGRRLMFRSAAKFRSPAQTATDVLKKLPVVEQARYSLRLAARHRLRHGITQEDGIRYCGECQCSLTIAEYVCSNCYATACDAIDKELADAQARAAR